MDYVRWVFQVIGVLATFDFVIKCCESKIQEKFIRFFSSEKWVLSCYLIVLGATYLSDEGTALAKTIWLFTGLMGLVYYFTNKASLKDSKYEFASLFFFALFIGSMFAFSIHITFDISLKDIFDGISADAWVGYFGAIIGGALTLCGVVLSYQKSKSDLKKQASIEHKPILRMRYRGGTPSRVNFSLENCGRGEAVYVHIKNDTDDLCSFSSPPGCTLILPNEEKEFSLDVELNKEKIAYLMYHRTPNEGLSKFTPIINNKNEVIEYDISGYFTIKCLNLFGEECITRVDYDIMLDNKGNYAQFGLLYQHYDFEKF